MKETTILIIGVYFGCLFALSRFKSVPINGRAIYLFRAFFPSWKFFEDYGDFPFLFYRLSSDGKDFGDWVPCLVRPRRNLSSVFVNSEGNLYLACTSLLQQLVSEVEDFKGESADGFEKTVMYQLTHNLVRFQIAQLRPLDDSLAYQFRLCLSLEVPSAVVSEDLLISPIYRGRTVVENAT